MVLCDTNVFFHAFNGRQETIDKLKAIGLEQITLSATTVMELYQGMGNKVERTALPPALAGLPPALAGGYRFDIEKCGFSQIPD